MKAYYDTLKPKHLKPGKLYQVVNRDPAYVSFFVYREMSTLSPCFNHLRPYQPFVALRVEDESIISVDYEEQDHEYIRGSWTQVLVGDYKGWIAFTTDNAFVEVTEDLV